MPGAIRFAEVSAIVDHVFQSLAALFSLGSDPTRDADTPVVLTPGSSELREVERATAFLGAKLASSERTGFDVAALLLSLRDVLEPLVEGSEVDEIARFIEWLAVVAVDSFGAARSRSVVEKYRDQLEEGTPVVHIVPELPAALLVGQPEWKVVDSVLSRLLLATVRVGAPALVIDVDGVPDPCSKAILEPLSKFLNHRKICGRIRALVVGVPAEDRGRWKELADGISFFDHFDRAAGEGMRLAGYRLVRSPATTN